MFRVIVLLVSFCFALYECAAIADTADSGRQGGLRDWMRNMKERMSNREPGRMGMGLMSAFNMTNLSKIKLPPAVISMMTGERMLQPVNLANVKFDPTSDRAYKMGNWYVIRRRSTSNNKDESTDDWSEFFDRKDDKWDVMNRADYGTTGCVISEPTKSMTTTTTTTVKEDSVQDLSAEVLNPTL